ncbi:hypothetical protein LJK88_14000 [Paenibacillus sp. P26]|nr:hypothetical protein LJK88_14000 [Paenibacillus sp. P26]
MNENAFELPTNGLPDAREQKPQQRVDVRDRADGRSGVTAEPFLVDDDSGGQMFDRVRFGRAEFRETVADERTERFVQLPRASAPIVSKTIDDLPEPDTPVKTVSFRFGTRSVISFKLFSRAPLMTMKF